MHRASALLPSISELGRDLIETTPRRRAATVAFPFALAALYFGAASSHRWLVAAPIAFALTYVSYGSVSHDLVHHALGLPPRVNDALLSLVELLVFRSGTAYRVTHLHHHRRLAFDDDEEGRPARQPLWRVLVESPVYVSRLWVWAWRFGPRRVSVGGSAWRHRSSPCSWQLRLRPHHERRCSPRMRSSSSSRPGASPSCSSSCSTTPAPTASSRGHAHTEGRLVPALTLEHLFHLEHHLYPMVPAHRWRELARRLDPHLRARGRTCRNPPMKWRQARWELHQSLVGAILVVTGFAAWGIAATSQLLPHDARFLGMTARTLCGLHACRIVHFMVHDRVSFGGSLIAIGVLYIWLAAGPLARGEAWAFWLFALSGALGFASFLAYLGYGYLDVWHGRATLALLLPFVVGVARSWKLITAAERDPRALLRPAWRPTLGSREGLGRAFLLFTAGSMVLSGATIAVIGMTRVFVPPGPRVHGDDRRGAPCPQSASRAASSRTIAPGLAEDCAAAASRFFHVWCGARPKGAILSGGRCSWPASWGLARRSGFTRSWAISASSHLPPALVGAATFHSGHRAPVGAALRPEPVVSHPSRDVSAGFPRTLFSTERPYVPSFIDSVMAS